MIGRPLRGMIGRSRRRPGDPATPSSGADRRTRPLRHRVRW